MLERQRKHSRKLRIAGLLWAFVLTNMQFQSALGANYSESLKVSITWTHEQSLAMPPESVLTSEWPSICKSIGETLLAPTYFWGTGVLSGYQCVSSPKRSDAFTNEISLNIHDSKDGIDVTVSDLASGQAVKGNFSLPPSKKSVLAFRDDRYRNLFAQLVFDTLPMAFRITEDDIEDTDLSFEFPTTIESAKEFRLPKSIYLYRLFWDERFKLWKSEIVGQGGDLKVDLKKAKVLLHQRQQGTGQVTIRWTLNSKDPIDFSKGVIWAHNKKGPDGLAKVLRSQIVSQSKLIDDLDTGELMAQENFLSSMLQAPFSSAHLGARFGLPLLHDAPYGSKTTFIGLLAEVRSGALDGLRFNADIWPRVSDTFPAGAGEFEGSRYIVGWSFRFKLPFPWFADYIDICPAIGQWSFKIDVPYEEPRTKRNYLPQFNAENALSFGIGVGLEWIGEEYLLRLWYSQDLGLALGNAVDSSNVITNRFGVDGMYRVLIFKVRRSVMTSSILGFVGSDRITLERTSTAVAPGNHDPVLGSIEYVQIYGGGGMSISW